MITKIHYYKTDNTIPYKNIALEEYLLNNVQQDECILYLWQNRSTVVIGRNQNAWKECRTVELEEADGFLARRLSGGGAVFHDLGNLNFTFLVKEKNYDVEKQLDVILRAVQKLGIKAEKSGRNDIVVDGYKFSGNAFYSSKGNNYHHGTIMFNVNKDDISKYLNVSKKKLESKGIESVRSRVANLTEFNPDITLEQLSDSLIEAFGEVYELSPQPLPEQRIDAKAVKQTADVFGSWEWKYGSTMRFSYDFEDRFDWGEVDIRLEMKDGIISDTIIYSDSLNPHYILELEEALKGVKFSSAQMSDVVDKLESSKENPEIATGIKTLIMQQQI